jgi:hypothetical protein
MRSLRFLLLSSLLVCAAGGTVAAQASRLGPEPIDPPNRYFLRDLDGRLARVENSTDGRTYAVWAYRNRGEFDLAIAVRDAAGHWSAPSFLGAGDSLSQMQPSLAVDSNGNLYLAYSERETGLIYLTMRAAGGVAWSEPTRIAVDSQRHWMPALRVVGNRLVVAYRSPSGTEIVDFALLPPAATQRPTGVQDGPDGFPPSESIPPPDSPNEEDPLGSNN